MNRHILGLSVFLIIVKTTFLLYWGFFAPKPFANFVETEVYSQSSRQTNCFPTLDKPLAAPVEMATLDLNAKTINVDLDLNKQVKHFDSAGNYSFTLNFYLKNPQAHKFATEHVGINPEQVDANNIAQLKFPASTLFDQIESGQTLYVVSEEASVGMEKTKRVDFDENNAIPVLIINRKK